LALCWGKTAVVKKEKKTQLGDKRTGLEEILGNPATGGPGKVVNICLCFNHSAKEKKGGNKVRKKNFISMPVSAIAKRRRFDYDCAWAR